VRHDRALVGGGHGRLAWHCPTLLKRPDIAQWSRTVIIGRSWIVKWTSWFLRTEIHLSPVSDTWLRAHQGDWNKHGVDV
jgi:hypothetical protein